MPEVPIETEAQRRLRLRAQARRSPSAARIRSTTAAFERADAFEEAATAKQPTMTMQERARSAQFGVDASGVRLSKPERSPFEEATLNRLVLKPLETIDRTIGTAVNLGIQTLAAQSGGVGSQKPRENIARLDERLPEVTEGFRQQQGREPGFNERLSLVQDAANTPDKFQGISEVIGGVLTPLPGPSTVRGAVNLGRRAITRAGRAEDVGTAARNLLRSETGAVGRNVGDEGAGTLRAADEVAAAVEPGPPPPVAPAAAATPPAQMASQATKSFGEMTPAERFRALRDDPAALMESRQAEAAATPPARPPEQPPAPPRGPEPPSGGPPAVPPPDDFAANIRLEKYPDDIGETLQDWAARNPDKVQAARRGVIPDAEVLERGRALAEDMGADFAKIQKRWKPGEAWNAEEITAIRGVLREKTERVIEAATTARQNNSAENIAKLFMSLQEQSRVQEIVHGITAEAGRSLRAFRQEVAEGFASNPNASQVEALLRKLGIKRDNMEEFAEKLLQLDLNNPVAINEFIRTLQKPNAWDYLTEIWMNSILSGPKTHLINTISNAANVLLSPIERVGSASVENVLARLQGRQVERYFDEALDDVVGAISGLDEGLRGAAQTLRYGLSPAQSTKLEFRPRAFNQIAGRKTPLLGRAVNLPSNMLEASDAFFYSVNYRASLNALARRQARKEGLKGQALLERVADLRGAPTENIIREAKKQAEYRLFRQDPGKFIQSIMAAREQFPMLRLVIPFLRTPTNLLKYGLERSPAGFLNPRLYRNLAAKSPEASDEIARALMGTIGTAGIAVAFGQGRITGRAPTDQAERDRFYREGKLPYAIKIGPYWIQYQRLEPFNQVFGQVAAVADAVQDGEDEDSVIDRAQRASATLSQNFVSQTFMSGLADALNASSQPDRYAGDYVRHIVSSFVPYSALLRTGAQIDDPTFKRSEGLKETVQANIPGLSRNVPGIQTAFGDEAQRPGAVWFPIQFSREQQTAIDAELEAHDVEVGFAGNVINGETLSREWQREYQRVSGGFIRESLANLIADPAYQGLEAVYKPSVLENVISDARAFGRAVIAQDMARGVTPAVEAEGSRFAPKTGDGSRFAPKPSQRQRRTAAQEPVTPTPEPERGFDFTFDDEGRPTGVRELVAR